jgi:serine/threonine protein kinase
MTSEETTQPTERLLNKKYRVIELISEEGGFGRIYKVEEIHPHFDPEIFALKKLIPQKDWDNETIEAAKKAFLNEAITLKKLNISYVPKVRDFFIEDEFLYLVMDYIEGDNLEKIIKQKEPSLDEAVSIVEKLLKTLHSLHTSEQHIIHRDIKPRNIILRSEEVWLVDFGLAKNSELKTILPGAGTLSYSPLEQYRQLLTDERSDIYSVGATFYRLLTGKKPPDSMDRFQKLEIAKSDDPIPNLIKEFPQIPKLIAEVVYKALALYQEERFATASEMLEAIREANKKASDADEHFEKGQKYFAQKDWDKATAEFERVIELEPNSHKAFFKLGYCYTEKGENETAIQHYSEAIKLKPNDHASLHNRSLCYEEIGDVANEIADANRAVELSDNTLYRAHRIGAYIKVIKNDLKFLIEKSNPKSDTYKRAKRRLLKLDEIDLTFNTSLILIFLVILAVGIGIFYLSTLSNNVANGNSDSGITSNINSESSTKKINNPILIGSPYEITLTPVEVGTIGWETYPCEDVVIFSSSDKTKWIKASTLCSNHFSMLVIEIQDSFGQFDQKKLSLSEAKPQSIIQLETGNFKGIFTIKESETGSDPDPVRPYPLVFKRVVLSVQVQEKQKK